MIKLEQIRTYKLGYKEYAIKRPEEIIETGGELSGKINFEKHEICISDKLMQGDKNCTFIHEMVHAICEKYDLQALNEDEHTIELLTQGIYESIIQNPDIFVMSDI